MKLRLLTVLLLLPLAAFAASPSTERGRLQAPLSPQDAGPLRLAPVDAAKLLAEDALLAGKLGLPLRYGVVQAVEGVSLEAAKSSGGIWTTLADGRLQWQLEVVAQDASSLEFAFSSLRLPAGAQLMLRALDSKQTLGPLTDADNRANGRYHTAMLAGSHAMLELTLPAAKRAHLALALDYVVHGYRDPFAAQTQQAQSQQKSGSCNIDTICPQGDVWREQISAVASYTFQSGGSSALCTGTLMATGNQAQDLAAPRFSTANHCVSAAAEAQSMVFYWGYESPTCRAIGSAASGQSISRTTNNRATQSGASLLATHEPTDFTAVQLSTAVPTAARATYSGWDRSANIPRGSVGIHHPQGHEKRITFNSDPLLTEGNCSISGRVAGNTHWLITQYESGTTEGGSSGSGLWNPSNQLLVGVLSGGIASCALPSEYDCYGKLSVAWESGGTPTSRMRDWFDRSGNNPETLPGIGSCAAPSATLDSPAFTSATAGQNLQFTATASGGAAGARTYHWDVDGDGNVDRVGSASSITISFPRAQQAQVSVRVVDSAGCGTTVARALDVTGATLTATAGTPAQVCGDNDAAIEPGERWRVPVTLRNTGSVALPAGARALFVPGAASSGILPIGPNSFGYRATTSAQGGCGYSFVDIAAGANSVPALATSSVTSDTRDDARTTQTIALGGSGFRLYGQTYTQAVMSTNGYVSFSPSDTGGDFSNDCTGAYTSGGVGPQLRVHHDDLVVSTQTGAGLRYRYFASCPRTAEADSAQAQGCHVFQWSGMQLFTSNTTPPSGDFEFEAVAYERTGQVSYQYRTAAPDAGQSSTLGISNPAGNDPLNVGCDAANSAPAQSAICVFEPSALPSSSINLRLESPTLPVSALGAGQQANVDVPFAIPTNASCGATLGLDYIATAAPGSYSLDTKSVLATTLGAGGACQTSNNCPAQVPTIATRQSLYSNPARGGNGIAHFIYGGTYGGAWYTALTNRTPTWYTVAGSYADNLATAPIERYRNTAAPGGFTTAHEVIGRAWVAQIDPDSVLYAWSLNSGSKGAELMDAVALPFSQPNHTQTWYAPSQPGWGLAIESLSTGPGSALEFIGAYIYDDTGVARWVVGDSTSTSGGNVPLISHRPHCPGCPWFSDWATAGASAGSLTRTYTGPASATLGTAITLPAPLSGVWNRSSLPIITIGPPAAKSQE